ncbi:hypothetical protein K8354_04590 [Polaribacter litorisediminis]|uniref:hypothetical protein n=1 Tax=Polaribacter litorisediminis TaxID=1908341 RepID=UPI001CC0747B|nr:hypothetical protein [Polaribacter litorisediminis]UAM99108.1 hypothetical protein K8354_04590 [Polaribacter litorisediminis]
MKRKIIFVILVFLFVNYNYSQNKKDSLKAYNEIKNWAVAKLTIAYIEDLRTWDNNTKLKPSNSEQKKEWDSYNKIKNKYSKYSDSVNLDELSNQLSIGWKKTRDSVFKRYKLELIDSTVSLHFKNIAFVPKMSKIDEIPKQPRKRKEAIQLINEEYQKFITTYNTTTKNVNENSSNNIQDRNPRRLSKAKEFSTLFIVLLGFSFLFNIFLIFKLISSKKALLKTKNGKKYWKDQNEVSKKEIASLNGKIETITNKDLREIKSFQTTKVVDQLSNVNISRPIVQSRKDEIKNDTKNKDTEPIEDEKAITVNLDIQKPKSTLIYLPAPFEEKRFASEDASEGIKQTSLYQAELTEDSNEVYFTLMETVDLSRALNSPNIYLETACDYENTYTTNAKTIEVVEKGIIRLEGKDWVVKKKIRIKFN